MKRKLWSLMCVVVVASLFLRASPVSAQPPPPTISANPETVTLEATDKTGKTTLWYNGGPKHLYVEVWVAVDGADLKKVLEDEGDGKGTRTVTVEMGKKYRYVLTDFGKELAAVDVRVVTKSTTTTKYTGGINTSKPADLSKPPAATYIVCDTVDWIRVDLDAGLRWFTSQGKPVVGQVPETKDSLTAMLKKHGFETQHRRVEGKGDSVKVHLFARLTKNTKTVNTAAPERRDREVKAIADMVYEGQKSVGKKVFIYSTK